MEIVVVVALLGIFICFIFFVTKKMSRDEAVFLEVLSAQKDQLDGYGATMTIFQKQHYDALEKFSLKQFDQLTKQQKQFMDHLEKTEELLLSGDIVRYYATKQAPQKEQENTIDAPLDDSIDVGPETRIPITDNMKIQFEDEEGSLPVTLS